MSLISPPAAGPALGGDGLFTLLLSNLVLAGSLGLTGLTALRRTWRAARHTPATIRCDLLLVLGKRLLPDGSLDRDYLARLDRAAALYHAGACGRLLLLGGTTRPGLPSEATAGHRRLIALGVPAEALLLEEGSRHTLENLRNAREQLRPLGPLTLGLTTSRYHLGRVAALAGGLRLDARLCAAESHLTLTPRVALRLLGEAYYLHWYHVGRIWSHATGNRASIARIS